MKSNWLSARKANDEAKERLNIAAKSRSDWAPPLCPFGDDVLTTVKKLGEVHVNIIAATGTPILCRHRKSIGNLMVEPSTSHSCFTCVNKLNAGLISATLTLVSRHPTRKGWTSYEWEAGYIELGSVFRRFDASSSSQNGNDPCSKVHFSMSAIRLGTAVCQLSTSGGGINISNLEQRVLCVSVSRSLL
jgi:hypothetical protein